MKMSLAKQSEEGQRADVGSLGLDFWALLSGQLDGTGTPCAGCREDPTALTLTHQDLSSVHEIVTHLQASVP